MNTICNQMFQQFPVRLPPAFLLLPCSYLSPNSFSLIYLNQRLNPLYTSCPVGMMYLGGRMNPSPPLPPSSGLGRSSMVNP